LVDVKLAQPSASAQQLDDAAAPASANAACSPNLLTLPYYYCRNG